VTGDDIGLSVWHRNKTCKCAVSETKTKLICFLLCQRNSSFKTNSQQSIGMFMVVHLLKTICSAGWVCFASQQCAVPYTSFHKVIFGHEANTGVWPCVMCSY